jgi:capsular polysaccharide biosynthesis protein
LALTAEQDRAQEQRPGAVAGYTSAIRAHALLVLLITLGTVAASVLFLAARSPDYEATADVLVQPLPADDQSFLGLPLIRDTGDPVRTMQTAASLVESRAAAAQVAAQPGEVLSADEILDRIKVSPEGQSNILAVTASEDSADDAAQLANRFSRAVLAVRSAEVAKAAGSLIAQLQAALQAAPDTATRADLAGRLDQVNSVVRSGDPTLQLSQPAIPPTSASGPSAPLILVLALLAGFALGSCTAVLIELATGQTRDRRARR